MSSDAGRTGADLRRTSLADIRLQVMWNRLLSVVEEQARDAGAHRLLDQRARGGRHLRRRLRPRGPDAGPGGHRHAGARELHGAQRHPFHPRIPGRDDAAGRRTSSPTIPWKGTGHLYDIVVTSPAFHKGRLVALFSCTTHVVDIGGLGQSPDGRQVFHEGLFLPLLPLMRRRRDGRERDAASSAPTCASRCRSRATSTPWSPATPRRAAALGDMMRGTRHRRPRRAGRAHHRPAAAPAWWRPSAALPQRQLARRDAHRRLRRADRPARRRSPSPATMSRWTMPGPRPSSISGINCPMCYTEAYTAFGIKCVVAPTIPNNAGTLDAVLVTAPEGTHRQCAPGRRR